jgi:hypothetical protein
MIGNPRVSRFLERQHPEILTEFKAIVAATFIGGKRHNVIG